MKQQYRIIFLATIFLLSNKIVMAQIGVNIESPRGVFHVDSKINTPESGTPAPGFVLDDVLVDKEGNLGIGTISPKSKMHIITGGSAVSPKKGLKIDDGSQANLHVLLSDANGAGKWAAAPAVPAAIATKVGVNIPSTAAAIFYNTNSYISLPPGRWLVSVMTLMQPVNITPATITTNDKLWVHALFTESTAATGVTVSPDVEGSKQLASLITKRTFGILSGSCVIHNKTASTKDYYYAVGAFGQLGTNEGSVTYQRVAGTLNDENSIIALLLQDTL